MVELSWADLIVGLPVILTSASPHVYATLLVILGTPSILGWLIENKGMICKSPN